MHALFSSRQSRPPAALTRLPSSCKALLTSRPSMGLRSFSAERLVIATGRRLKLQQLDQIAALQTLADIAHDNAALAAAPEPDRLRLITEIGGNTLLLTWTAWQVGSGYCTTIADALAHLRSCPQGNDPPFRSQCSIQQSRSRGLIPQIASGTPYFPCNLHHALELDLLG